MGIPCVERPTLAPTHPGGKTHNRPLFRDAAGDTTRDRARPEAGQRAQRDNRTDAGNGQQPQARGHAGRAARKIVKKACSARFGQQGVGSKF